MSRQMRNRRPREVRSRVDIHRRLASSTRLGCLRAFLRPARRIIRGSDSSGDLLRGTARGGWVYDGRVFEVSGRGEEESPIGTEC